MCLYPGRICAVESRQHIKDDTLIPVIKKVNFLMENLLQVNL